MTAISLLTGEGQSIIAANHYRQGSAVQFYGTCVDAVLAENTLEHMTNSYGIHPGGLNIFSMLYVSGMQPDMRVEVRNNTVMVRQPLSPFSTNI